MSPSYSFLKSFPSRLFAAVLCGSLFLALPHGPAAQTADKKDEKKETPVDLKTTDAPKAGDKPGDKPVTKSEDKKDAPGDAPAKEPAPKTAEIKSDKPTYNSLPLGPDGKPRPLSLKEAVQLVLKNNVDLKIQKLELKKADTEEKKDETKYAPIVGLTYQGLRKIDPASGATVFSGTKQYTDVLTGSVAKLFKSGTYFEVQLSDTRFDSNAGESVFATGILAQLAQPPLHTGSLKIILRQELVKNAFGYSQRRLNRIARNNSKILYENLVYSLSQLIVKTMVDYWTLAIAEENVKTAEVLLSNTRRIRSITIRKRRIGLAEGFEVNQWNALVSSFDAQLKNAQLERDAARRNLIRALNLKPGTELSGETQLVETMPTDVDAKQDVKWAFANRPEIKNLKLQMENARMALELAKNSRLPSVTIGGSLAHRDQGLRARTAFNEVPSGKFPEYSVEFKVEYPLWDAGSKADVRNAKVSLRQLSIQKSNLERQIRDEIAEGYQRIQVAHEVLEKTAGAERQNRAFYFGLLRRYRQGRFTAVAVKNALDALAQSRQALMQAKINFNISLVRYELTRNKIFQKYDIDVEKVLGKTGDK